jgi:hypothetical protein
MVISGKNGDFWSHPNHETSRTSLISPEKHGFIADLWLMNCWAHGRYHTTERHQLVG